MSVEITAEVWKHSKLNGNGLLLMVRLGDFADIHGFSWPGEDELASSVRCDVRTIKRLIKKAESFSEVVVFRGTKQGNRYVVICGCTEESARERLEIARLKVGSRRIDDKMSLKFFGDKSDTELVTSDETKPGIGDKAMSPDPLVVDPSIDPPLNPPAPKQKKQRDRDLIFDIICELAGIDPAMAPGKEIGTVKKKLLEIGWTIDGLTAFRNYRKANNLPPIGSVHWIAGEIAKKAWRQGQAPAGDRPVVTTTPASKRRDFTNADQN